jgi:integrase/recombinase XerD
MVYQCVREPLTPEAADELCNACDTTKEKLIVWVLLDTGLRVSELCSLSSDNILWQQKCIRVTGKGGPFGKKSKKRIVPMSRRVRTLLEHYFSINDEWFVQPRQVQRIVKGVANKAKISKEVTPHVLRHTFATLAIQKGISLPSIQKILGHDMLQTTAIYLNFTNTHLSEEFERKW